MQHRKTGRSFGRVRSQRRALIKTLLGSFFLREKMVTTEAKAKAIKPMIDRIITRAKRASSDAGKKIATVREFDSLLPKKATAKIFGGMMDKFEGRQSGYTRIIKLGQRKTDAAKMAKIALV